MEWIRYIFWRDYAMHKTVKERLDQQDSAYITLLHKLCEQEKRIKDLERLVNGVDASSKPVHPLHDIDKPGDRQYGGI